jgi:long-chain acyl-CoA synthetase
MTGAESSDSVIVRLREVGGRTGERQALIYGEQRWSYAELAAATDRLAYALRDVGLGAGERIALVLGNTPAFVFAYLASLRAGGVVVPLNPASPPEALTAILRDCTPAVAFMEQRHRPHLTAIAAQLPDLRAVYIAGIDDVQTAGEIPPVVGMAKLLRLPTGQLPFETPPATTLAAIVYTSGTTGRPKGVMLSHGNLAAIATAGRGLVSLRSEDRVGVINPLFHLYGLRDLDAALGAGATMVLPSDPAYPARALGQLHAERVSGMSAVPSAVTLFLERYRPQLAACAEHLRYLAIGTAFVSKTLLTTLRAVLPATQLYVTYGLTENSRVCWREVTDPASDEEEGAVGRPYPGVQLWLVDAVDGLGRVALRSPMVMQGYWQRPDATQEVLGADGTLLTPDLGRLGRDGTLYLVGRIDEVINRGGEKVSPEEVEEALCQHPAVGAAAVFAAPDPAGVLGQVVWAVVVCRPGVTVTAPELLRYAAARLEPYKVPQQIEFAERLPRAVLGKVRRRQLREQGEHSAERRSWVPRRGVEG